MLKWISLAPGITIEILSIVLDLSERGVYRYLRDLKKAGIIVCQNGRGSYQLQDGDLISSVKLFDYKVLEAENDK